MVAQSQPWGCQIAVKKLETSNIAAKPPLIIFIFGEKIDVFAKTKESITQGFFQAFFLPLFDGKSSIFNWVSKLNPPSFIILTTPIPLKLLKFCS